MIHCCTLAVISLAILGDTPAREIEGRKGFPVKVSVSTESTNAGAEQTIKVFLDIDKGWEVYANPVENSDLERAQITLAIKAKQAFKKFAIKYPPGEVRTIEEFGTYRVLTGKVVLQAFVQREESDRTPLEVSLFVLPMHLTKALCIQPARFKTTLP